MTLILFKIFCTSAVFAMFGLLSEIIFFMNKTTPDLLKKFNLYSLAITIIFGVISFISLVWIGN